MSATQKRCRFCDEPFRRDPRVGDRQYACPAPACQAQRKRECQERWSEAHPDYFRGQYPKKRPWHDAHPGYLAEYRRSHPEAAQHHRDQERQRRQAERSAVDIQDECRIQSLLSQDVAGVTPRMDIQDEMPLQRSILLGLIERLRAEGRVDIQGQIDQAVLQCYKAGRRLQTREVTS